MRISNSEIHKVLALHLQRVGGPQKATQTSHVARPDQLTLSRKATEMQDIKQMLTRLPDMRVGVVKDFKNRVQAGVYEVSEMEIAQNMLATAIQNRVGA